MSIATYIPPMNSFRFVKRDYSMPAKYHFAHFDRILYADWIRPAQRKIYYAQKVQNIQRCVIQLHSTADDFCELSIYNCEGELLQADIVPDNYAMPGNEINGIAAITYQFNFSFSDYSIDEGRCYFIINLQSSDGESTDQWISEPLDVKESHPGTILFEYSHNRNDFDIIFGYPFYPRFPLRVEGRYKRPTPASVDQQFRDGAYNPKILSSYPFRKWQLVIGGKYGVPEYMISDKMNNVLACRTWFLDGKLFVKEDGATWDTTETETYPLQNATISILDGDIASSYTASSNKLFLYEIPAYPFAIGYLNLATGVSNITPLSGARNIEDNTEHLSFVTDLNTTIANSQNLGGTFTISGGSVYYEVADGETFNQVFSWLSEDFITITLTPTITTGEFRMKFKGGFMVADWLDAIQFLGVSGPVPTTVNVTHNFASGTSYDIRLFHKNETKEFISDDSSGGVELNDIIGNISSQLTLFKLSFQNITDLDGSFLLPTAATLTSLQIIFSGMDSINSFFSLTTVPFAWNSLLYIAFSFNNIVTSNVDDILNDFYAGASYGTGGTFVLSGQTPSAPPTLASLTARNDLQASGWTIITD